jgi:hypothetical protein
MKKVIHRNGDTFYKAVETINFVFYVDYRESDEMNAVLMFDRSSKLLSDNCHAANELYCILEEKRYTHLSPTMRYNVLQMQLD